MNPNPDRLLRNALRGNATFSTFCGVASIAWATPLASVLGIEPPFSLVALGLQLIAFAALLLWLASRESIRPAIALGVIAADALWVLGTLPLLLAGLLTPTGAWIAFAIANVVGAFAVLQYLGVRRLREVGTVAA